MRRAEQKYLSELGEATVRSDLKQARFCERRKHFLCAYLGDDWGDTGATRPSDGGTARALNMTYSAVSVLVPLLVAQNPRVDVSTPYRQYRPSAYELKMVLDQELAQQRVAEKMRHIVADMIFGAGIAVVGLGPGRIIDVADESIDVGKPYFDRVSLDRYFCDPEAETRDDLFFEGHTYEMPYEWLMDNRSMFDNLDKVSSDDTEPDEGRARARDLSGTRKTGARRIVPTVTMRNIFLRPPHPWGKEPVILTAAGKGRTLIPLLVTPWHGTDRGPYEMLGALPVPDNVMPMSPAAGFSALDDLVNTLARKLHGMARNMKTLLLYELPVALDAEAVAKAGHGETVGVHPGALNQMREVKFMGPDQSLHSTLQWLVMMFSRQAGNIDMLGGLNADARSATEASLLHTSATVRMQDMKRQVYSFMDACLEKMAYFIVRDLRITSEVKRLREAGVPVNDSATPRIVSIPIPGLEAGLTRTVDGDRILGDFMDYTFRIEPYSMDISDPEMQARKLLELVSGVILPLANLAAQQGAQLDVAALVENVARAMHIDLIDEVFTPGVPTSVSEARESVLYRMPWRETTGPGSGTGAPQTRRAPEAVKKEREVRSHAAAAAP